MKIIKIGLIQPFVSQDNSINFNEMEKLIALACCENPKILCLPERWYFVDPLSSSFESCIQSERGIQYQKVKEWAKKYHVAIISGGVWEWHAGFDRPFISSYYFDANGLELFRQDKIHLYGLEQTVFQPGNEIIVFTHEALNLCFSILICFDLNISNDLASIAIKNGAEMLFSPTLIRNNGKENWNIYIQARALENRCPILSCNSVFNYLDRKFAGESKIISFIAGSSSPVKLDISEASNNAQFLVKDINFSFPNRIRRSRLKEHYIVSEIKVLQKSFP